MKSGKSVVVINDTIGEMALAFDMAGFNVLCDAVNDDGNMNIVRANLDTQVLKITEECFGQFPKASILVGRLQKTAFSVVVKQYSIEREGIMDKTNYVNYNISKYIEINVPAIFLLETIIGTIRLKEFDDWMRQVSGYGYNIQCQTIDTAEITGMPVRERRVYIVGVKKALNIEFEFHFDKTKQIPWKEIIGKNTEETYLPEEKTLNINFDGNGVYDYKGKYYEKSETVKLAWRIPLVVENKKARRFSAKEIATLKGFPENYNLFVGSRYWIKNKLFYSSNVLVYKKFADQFQKMDFTDMDNQLGIAKEKAAVPIPLQEISKKKEFERSEDIMERRFDVFVSSTYEDLIEERKEITQACLECDCMPVGMEMFPASNMEQWEFIKKVIDKADIYLVIVAGKYGSLGVDEQGNRMSYTEMEFNYARSTGKPILAFLHKDINRLTRDKVEIDNERVEALNAFRGKVTKDRMVKFYTNKDELRANVLSSINSSKKLIKEGGWIRAEHSTSVANSGMKTQIDALQQSNKELNQKIQKMTKEKETLELQWKEEQILVRSACEREKKIALQYEKMKNKIVDLAEEIKETK